MDYSVDECKRCEDLVENRSRIVNGVGDGSADVMFVGEAPGKKEDQDGEPFVGRSGSLLDELLDKHGLNREEIRITNTVRCRPPDNRNPYVGEIDNCSGYLEREIEEVEPKVVSPLGMVATENLLGEKVKMGEVQGERYVREGYVLIPCYHPAAVLYDRSKEEDLDETMEKICNEADDC
ncbi:MAG: uracil-DNA glycosylase family protein [Halobacteria archaeon]